MRRKFLPNFRQKFSPITNSVKLAYSCLVVVVVVQLFFLFPQQSVSSLSICLCADYVLVDCVMRSVLYCSFTLLIYFTC